VLATGADVAGLSCYVWNITALLGAAAAIKTRNSRVRVVLGGPEVGPVAADTLRANPALDAVVHSEGEIPFAELISAWQSGDDAAGVRGLSFRRGETIVDTGAAPLVADLGEYPSPHLDGYLDCRGRVTCVETQRGCVFQCNFCFYNKDFSLRNRRVPMARVQQELLHALDHDPQEIYLMDPVFNLNMARAKEICRFIAAHNPRRVPIHSEIWAEFVDDELAALMKAAHFDFLEVGLQTTDETVLASAERRLRRARFTEGIEHLRRHGLRFEIQLIYGLPDETRATFRTSLNDAIALDPPNLSVFRLMVLPGTDLWRRARQFDLEFDPEPPYHVRSHRSMSEADVEYGHRLLKSANFLQGSRTLRLLAREGGLSFADLVDEWLEWRGGRPVEADNAAVREFIAHVCAVRDIPAAFYERFGRAELV
jgi:radical SAM superfamily enzyme YgiQ (UPF0313 family)